MAVKPDDSEITEITHVEGANENIEDWSTNGDAKTCATKPDSFKIFVIGKTGAGKSSLVNSILEIEDAKVREGPHPCKHELIEEYEGDFIDVPTVIYDTRGLGDRSLNTRDYVAAFKDKLKKCGDQFLIFICQKYTEKFDDSVAQFVKLLSKHFRREYNIWSNSILVLTQANTVSWRRDDESNETKKAKREITMAEWGLEFQRCFQENGVSLKIIQGMPVCVAGETGTEHLLTDNWKEVLRDTCLSTNQDKSIMKLQQKTERSGTKVGACAGAVTGGIIIPVIGAPIGMTVGALVGLAAGRDRAKKKVKEREEKRFFERVIEKLKKPESGRFSFL